MEGNRLCSLCSTEPAAQFCICSNFPLLCAVCRPTHEGKSGFHFTLPLQALAHITPQNQQQYRLWLVSVANSQEKLKENLPRIDQCREEIEALYAYIRGEIEKTRLQFLHTLEDLKTALSAKIEEAIVETSTNAYLGSYQPSSTLATLIWTHSCENSSEPLPVFSYQIKTEVEALQDCLGVSLRIDVPELQHFGRESGDLAAEREQLKKLTEERVLFEEHLKVLEVGNREKVDEIEILKKRLEETEKHYAQELVSHRNRMDKDASVHFAREKESRAEIEKLKAITNSKFSVHSDITFGPRVDRPPLSVPKLGPLIQAPQPATADLKPSMSSMGKLPYPPHKFGLPPPKFGPHPIIPREPLDGKVAPNFAKCLKCKEKYCLPPTKLCPVCAHNDECQSF